jgi:two-component system, chemotaxis family, sensor kinase CheA
MDDLSQYRDLYIATSKEYLRTLNASLLVLEKDQHHTKAIEDIFRCAHSLKSQSAAMGYTQTALLCHTVEDIFYAVRAGTRALTGALTDKLFTCLDALEGAIAAIESGVAEPDLSREVASLTTLADSVPAAPLAAAPLQVVLKPQGLKTIAVKVEVLDELMNILEELLVVRFRLKSITDDHENAELKNYYNKSQKLLDSLQYQVTQARAVPLNLVFGHFPRAMRDLAHAENKNVELVMTGGELEIDRTIIDKLDEPLIHLLRNAVSHGIKEAGTVTLAAKRERDYIRISIHDDGAGIPWQELARKAGAGPDANRNDLLFSGISTAPEVTEISGRGAGLKAVKKMVEECRGSIDVFSEPGQGTTFTIKLPLTLAIAKALIIKVGEKDYAIPSLAIERIIKVPYRGVKRTADQEMFVLDEQEIPLLRFERLLPDQQPVSSRGVSAADVLVVIVESQNELLGLVVDEVIDTADIVMKPVPAVFKSIRQFSGVTILNNGKAALILNPQEIL